MSPVFFRSFFVLMLIFGQWTPAAAASPSNDNFMNAEVISALPFFRVLDVEDATLEPDEPQTCLPTDRSVWFRFVPASTMILMADTLVENIPGGSSKISIYRAAGPGLTGLEPVQCVSSGGAMIFEAEGGQTYYFQVGALVGEPGTIHFGLSEVTSISGRVVDAATNAPLPGDAPPFAYVELYKVCGEGCLELISGTPTQPDGRFRFDSYLGFTPGTYMLKVLAGLYGVKEFGPFEYTGANLDVGDLALSAPPPIRAIQGRVVEKGTGKPILANFNPNVYLYRCLEGQCPEYVSMQSVGPDGRFRFETDGDGRPLPAGNYVVSAGAEGYDGASSAIFAVGADETRTLNTLRLRSWPIRFSDVKTCPDIPGQGGECVYSMRIWNGRPGTFEGEVWGIAYANLYESVTGFVSFQVKDAQKLVLGPGKSKVVRFRLTLPEGKSPSDTNLCIHTLVGRGDNARFNVVGERSLFCYLSTQDGSVPQPPEEASSLPARPESTEAVVMDTEPNNSCIEAQDAGQLSLPFHLNGNLTSSETPDVDFYRVHGSPGEPVVIDLEGQSSGVGTLVDPLLGVYDSSCTQIKVNDNSGSLNSRVPVIIPPDGVLILAATDSRDWWFEGGGEGTYQLTVSHLQAIGSISGSVVDAVTNVPVSGGEPFYPSLVLSRCDNEFSCTDVLYGDVGSDGRFVLDREFDGTPFLPSTYLLIVYASQYQAFSSEPFTVAENEDFDLGDLALTPWPIQLTDVGGCALPAGSGMCEFSVKATNTLSTRFSGKAWSLVSAFRMEPFADGTPFWGTTFQTDTPLALRLGPGESKLLHFRFRVPRSVPDGVWICPHTYTGQNPNAFFNPVGEIFMPCFVKGTEGLGVASPANTQAAIRQMLLQQLNLSQPIREIQQ
jgi:hypothetical protein